jgi:hypothetical protein
MKEDYASLMEWFYENEETFVIPFIEQNYKECSWEYEYNFMMRHIIFTRTVIEDYKMTNDEKILEFTKKVYYGKSKIILIIGARGSGKTATALYFAEQAKIHGGHRVIYYVGTPENKEIYPPWFKFINDIDDVPISSFAIIDEAAIKYSARNFQKEENKDLTNQMVIARHRDITLVLITQNMNLVDINIRRLSDILIFKEGSDYGIQKKRGEVMSREQKEKMLILKRMKPTTKEECLIEYTSQAVSIYRKIVVPLPTFWDDETISKSFRSFKKPVVQQKEIKSIERQQEDDLLG